MLRSLVGSEMCIRDRDSSRLLCVLLPHERREGGVKLSGEQVQPDLNTLLCLLYTSDAADDLLCVDLGGRRIIKKKNQ